MKNYRENTPGAAVAADQRAKADGGKLDPTLLNNDFVDALESVNAIYQYGMIKYERGSWSKVEYKRWDAAVQRHQRKIAQGITIDDESGLPHLAHVTAGLLIMLQMEYDAGKLGLDITTFKQPPQDHKK